MTLPATATETYFRAASASLAVGSDPAEPGRPAALLERHYGLTGTITCLSSEAESTFAVTLQNGRRLILKTSTRPEAIASFRFQAAALAGLRWGQGFRVPDVIHTRNGALMFQHAGVWGYLQTRLDGEPLHQAALTPDLLFHTGSALARLDLALGRLTLPATDRPILWHIGCWPRLTELESHLPCGIVAENVRTAMRDYAAFVEPQIALVPWQVTHNDPSPYNMMVAGCGLGFIDFGDGCHSPRVQDLAIAASHLVTDPSLPLGGAEPLIAGYAAVIPLSALEASLLVGLMRARQSALILVNYWRAQLFPAEAQYIKKNVARAERGLSILTALDTASGEAAVRATLASRQA